MNQEEGFISIIFIYYWANSVVDICLLFVSFLLLVVLLLSYLICTIPITILAFSQCSVLSSLFLVLSCHILFCCILSYCLVLLCLVLSILFNPFTGLFSLTLLLSLAFLISTFNLLLSPFHHLLNCHLTTHHHTTALLRNVLTTYEKGRPCLIGTTSVESSEEMVQALRDLNIPAQARTAHYRTYICFAWSCKH